MTRKNYTALAAALREDAAHLAAPRDTDLSAEDGAPFDYSTAEPWQRGAYDQWHTAVLAIAAVLAADSGYDVNGNRRFDRERFLAAAGFAA